MTNPGQRGTGGSHPPSPRRRICRDMSLLEAASDATLMVAVGRWQEAALAEIYRRHGAAVHHVARLVLRSSHFADEVTQEVFVDLWKRPEQFDASRGSLRTLLITKAHGRAVDVVRAENARRSREQQRAAEATSFSYDIDDYAWDLVIGDQVKVAVAGLPDDERVAIEMAYFDGLTYRQVAELLGAPEGTIKSRMRNGLRRLRATLVRQGIEAP